MSDFVVHLNLPSELHFTLSIPALDTIGIELYQGLAQLTSTLTSLGAKVSEASDQLTAAVQSVQAGFDTLNTTLQTEIQQIANALSSAPTDQALQTAAADAVARLSTLATSIEAMNTQIQGIIP